MIKSKSSMFLLEGTWRTAGSKVPYGSSQHDPWAVDSSPIQKISLDLDDGVMIKSSVIYQKSTRPVSCGLEILTGHVVQTRRHTPQRHRPADFPNIEINVWALQSANSEANFQRSILMTSGWDPSQFLFQSCTLPVTRNPCRTPQINLLGPGARHIQRRRSSWDILHTAGRRNSECQWSSFNEGGDQEGEL
ncbi:hypothetical protein E1B28_013678 [Marasmius oreades]|uniref:Uncharacterized protein n=1 Tax=Marasmius oreades TaxID=181124 RepID=A0A9P7RQB3_9AGAR|nr:uncharacterized protein E1B28_013678 [Marasmius oreades]KAG7087732.1 hypothetical protein E1B28_013678 [Marasmius oreades]